jgi:hypothetical protein
MTFWLCILCFSSKLDKILCVGCTKKVLIFCDFHENWLSERHTLVRGINEFFYVCFPHLYSDLMKFDISANNAVERL